MEIRAISNLPFPQIYQSFSEAFADYDMPPLSENELKHLIERRGVNYDLSFGAFDLGRLVSFTFNGIGLWNAVPTAYDTATGTIPEYRGKGLAKQIFLEAVPQLKKAGIRQYLLEVLQTNEKAIGLYQNMGFEVAREFDFYVPNVGQIRLPKNKLKIDFELKELNETPEIVTSEFWEFQPSWQNSFDSINRKLAGFTIVGAFEKEQLLGYGIIEPASGDIPQLAVHQSVRRKGVGLEIFRKLIALSAKDIVKVLNTDSSCKGIQAFFSAFSLSPLGSQYEMIKLL